MVNTAGNHQLFQAVFFIATLRLTSQAQKVTALKKRVDEVAESGFLK